jgi:DNA-binding transcriptional LysR family regulator
VGFFPKVLAQLSPDQGPASVMLAHQRLYSGEYVCVMRRDHVLAGTELTVDAFCKAHHLQVSFSGRAQGLVDEALGILGRKRRVLLTVNQYFTAGKVIASSDLITVLPYHLIASTGMSEVLTWKPLPFDLPEVHVDMFWHARDNHNLVHKWLREHILAVAEPSGSSNVIRARKKASG